MDVERIELPTADVHNVGEAAHVAEKVVAILKSAPADVRAFYANLGRELRVIERYRTEMFLHTADLLRGLDPDEIAHHLGGDWRCPACHTGGM